MHLGWFEQGIGFLSPARAVGGRRRLLKPGAFLLRCLLLLLLLSSAPASAEAKVQVGSRFVVLSRVCDCLPWEDCDACRLQAWPK